MLNYALATAAIREQVRQEEADLPLKNGQCRSRFFFHARPTQTVCLFFHGFTAAPYQFEPLGQACFEAGYNVLVPLLPGHGKAGNWNRKQPPPLTSDPMVYHRAVAEWLGIAKMLGDRVVVGGLSTGGTLAAWAALTYPQLVDRALLFAPFLGHKFKPVDWLIKTLPIYFEWFNKDAPGNFGYNGFQMPALRLFLEMAEDTVKQAKRKPISPILMVCSESDRVTNRQTQRQFFQTVVQQQPRSCYHCFDKRYKIRHRMMTQMEGNQYEDWVIHLAKAYIAQEETVQ
ncbi:alpha/beta hydrolase [Leptolyngbya sp. AN03gr2]|uniref:alpha/beta hydrolase n=1 Tax=unclassified Leptolyngbya TaxID=2650499 RepID=UPI003D317A46